MTNPPVGENAAGLLTERGEAHAASGSRSRSRRRGRNISSVTLASGTIKPILFDYHLHVKKSFGSTPSGYGKGKSIPIYRRL